MKNVKIFVVFFVLFLINSKWLIAQSPEWLFFSACEEAPLYEVNVICEDNDGNIWIGTSDGLIKFDRNDWMVFNQNNSILPDNKINDICVSQNNTIWIATEQGLVSYFNSSWELYNTSNSGLPVNSLNNVEIDNSNKVWIGTDENLTVFNGDVWESFTIPNCSMEVLHIDQSGYFWCGGGILGVVVFQDTIVAYYDRNNSGFPGNFAYSITNDLQGNILIGTDYGFTIFDGTTWESYNINNSDLPHNRVQSIAVSTTPENSEQIWIGTNEGLALKDGDNWQIFNSGNSYIINDHISDILIDEYGNKWIGYNGGISIYREGEILNISNHSEMGWFNKNQTDLNEFFGKAAWGDIDNDDDLDLIQFGIASYHYEEVFGEEYFYFNTDFYTNNNGELLYQTVNLQDFYGITNLVDIDNDNDIDLFLFGFIADIDNIYEFHRLYKNSEGAFHPVSMNWNYSDSWSHNDVSIDWADFNNDYMIDFALVNERGLFLYRNRGGRNFDKISIPYGHLSSGVVSWIDYDNDGDEDLFASGISYSNIKVSKIYKNEGGVFTELELGIPGFSNASVAWGDYDMDGDPDLLIMENERHYYNCKVYKNLGDNEFSDIHAGINGLYAGNAKFGDYDADGDLDVILSGQNSDGALMCKVYKNLGENTFIELTSNLFVGEPKSWISWDVDMDVLCGGLSLADYDNNNKLNIQFNGKYKTRVFDNEYFVDVRDYYTNKVYELSDATCNTKPEPPANLLAVTGENKVNLSWESGSDEQTLPLGLTYNVRVGTEPLGTDMISPLANPINGFRKIVNKGNVNQNTSIELENLLPGTYYWSVQSIDNHYAGSLFAEEQSFEIKRMPPELNVNVFSNLIANNFIDIVVLSNNSLITVPEVSICSEFDTSFCDMILVDGTKQIYKGSFELNSEGSHSIHTYAKKLLDGVDTTLVKNLNVVFLQKGDVKDVISPDNNAKVKIKKMLENDQYLFSHQYLNKKVTIYSFGPYLENINDMNIEISFEDSCFSRKDNLFIYRKNGDEWIKLDSKVLDCRNIIYAKTTQLGKFKIANDPNYSDSNIVPIKFQLYQNYPNPFNPVTTIKYNLHEDSQVLLTIYNSMGQKINELINDFQMAGSYSVIWDGKDRNSNQCSSGIYYYRIKTQELTEVKKMILLK